MVRPFWLLLVLAACGAHPSRPTDLSAGAWWELRSPRFVLRTDLDRKEAAERLAELESDYQALSEVYQLLFEGFEAPQVVTRVVVFARCDDLERLRSHHRGFVRQSSVDGELLVVMCAHDSETTQVFLHELSHVFNSVFGAIPVWLEEGLAMYLQTLHVEDGKVWVGALLRRSRIDVPSVSRLLGASYEQFHAGASEYSFYVASRNLVGVFLGRSEEDQHRFVRYLHLLHEGANRSTAWSQAVAGLSTDKLEHDMLRYDTRPGVMLWWLAHGPAVDHGPFSVARIRPGGVQALLIESELYADEQPRPSTALEDRVAAAEREDPSWGDGDLWRAEIASNA